MFQFTLENILRKHRRKNVVVAMHHPLYTYGPHGGSTTIKEHIFPLTQLEDNLYIPLPGLGTVAAFLRGAIGSKQDVAHQTYKELKRAVLIGAKKNGSFIFVSGHEHTLQYIENEPNEEGTTAQVVFRKKLKEKGLPSEDNIPTSFPLYEQGLDTIETVVSQTKAGEIGFVHKAILGTHHRNVYQHNYKFPVLDLSTHKGGLVPIKRGGGNQTNSLRLEDSSGKQYALRAMTPTAIPPLADAAGIYHTNPELFYVPKQPAMGIYNDEYGNDVYLLEERPAGDWDGTGAFGDSKKIIGTPDMADRLIKSHKHYVDNNWAVRSRLFDIMIGDWDRHDDQWRWARFEKEGEGEHDEHKLYRPIPRDRDQAFSRYDGAFAGFARLFMPFLRQLRVYGPEVDKIKWSTWSSRNFDRSFMNEAEWEDWQAQVKYIQDNVTDEVIEDAFKIWPQQVQDLTAKRQMYMAQRKENYLK